MASRASGSTAMRAMRAAENGKVVRHVPSRTLSWPPPPGAAAKTVNVNLSGPTALRSSASAPCPCRRRRLNAQPGSAKSTSRSNSSALSTRMNCGPDRPDGVAPRALPPGAGSSSSARRNPMPRCSAVEAMRHAPSSPRRSWMVTPSGLSGPQFFRVESAELFDLDVDFALPGWALSLRRLHGQGALALERKAVGPDRFTFTVFAAAPGGGGQLSVLDGTWRTTLPFSAARIARIAVEPDALDAIALDAPRHDA